MAKKARQRISYVLEHPNSSPGGHRLGVNGLAIDRENAILYSGGRDGVICAWDLKRSLQNTHAAVTDPSSHPNPKSIASFRTQTHAHTHWINDITLVQHHNALVSASSDLQVKLWRPLASDAQEPVPIGHHRDYAKCVATPNQSTNWVASGGLDRRIYLWDLSGKGQVLEIDVSGEEVVEKGSVYALGVTHSVLANGGPESIVRLWDPKSGKRITKFVGHTDMIRAILVSEEGDMVLSASADQTVKVWSVTAGRCMHTLTMHDHSVWALFSDDPGLNVFYSSDRSGLVVKTDVRDTMGDLDKGLCLAVAKEHEGVSKIVAWDGSIWTATARASINRWQDVDLTGELRLPEAYKQHRASMMSVRSKESTGPTAGAEGARTTIPAKSVLRISNTASFPLVIDRNADDPFQGQARKTDPSEVEVEPIYHSPVETIEGQFGLVKHKLLNDRRRVLTLDTAGDVLMWDLIQCRPIRSFGKRHLEDVEPEVNTKEAVAPWCSIDISSGNLTVVLEPYNCFDAEMYADELTLDEPIEFREDQRINLGKWVLRYLFANLIDEEIRRDEEFRQSLTKSPPTKKSRGGREAPPLSIDIPPLPKFDPTTQRANNNGSHPPVTPGLVIGLATPGSPMIQMGEGTFSPLEKMPSHLAGRPSVEQEDYFSDTIGTPEPPLTTRLTQGQIPGQEPPSTEESSAKNSTEVAKEKEKDKDKENGTKGSTTFNMKKFRMNMSFGTKKLSRSTSTAAAEKPALGTTAAAGGVDDKADESETSSTHEKEFDDSFLGVIQRLRSEYEKLISDHPDKPLDSKITPAPPNDTPPLNIPPGTKVIIQEETTGGSAEVYRGTVASVGADADIIEEKAPLWLGEALLLNVLPAKEPVKVSFVLYPWKDSLPPIASADGNNRLNANRMLRVKKILAYVAERIDPAYENEGDVEGEQQGEKEGEKKLKPEDWLELYCNEQLLPVKMTLATLRTHVWRGGTDVVLHYKSNGRKVIPWPPQAETVEEEGKEEETPA